MLRSALLLSLWCAVAAETTIPFSPGLRASVPSRRNLAFETIAGYLPLSKVTDENAIDLDQKEMLDALAMQTKEGTLAALRIYTEGANSNSVAEVVLDAPLTADVAGGTAVQGVASDGTQVSGTVFEAAVSGSTVLAIRYDTTDNQKFYVGCRVAASASPITDGCFASAGPLSIDGVDSLVTYSYDPLANNVSKRSLQSFSTSPEHASQDTYAYIRFVDYYGEFDFSNQIVLAAFEGRSTVLFKNFRNDFGVYSDDASRNEIVRIATVHTGLAMQIGFQMEEAIQNCNAGASDDAVNAWDTAVAYYTGSLEGTEGLGTGNLLYHLADLGCGGFEACTGGRSSVNTEISGSFAAGQGMLVEGDCASADTERAAIERWMIVPRIRSTLLAAYRAEHEEPPDELLSARATGFALSVAPLLYACDTAINLETVLPAGTVPAEGDFETLLGLFESAYDCLGIEPSMIGDLPNANDDESAPSPAPTTPAPTTQAPTTRAPTPAPSRSLEPGSVAPSITPAPSRSMAPSDPSPSTGDDGDPTAAPTTLAPSRSMAPSDPSPSTGGDGDPTAAPTTLAPSRSMAPTDPSPATGDDGDPTAAPTTPAPSESMAPTDPSPATGDDGDPTPAPTTPAPSESMAPSTNPTRRPVAPTEAPEPTPASIADLIMGPTPSLVQLGKLPTPAALTYVSTNVQRPSENSLPA